MENPVINSGMTKEKPNTSSANSLKSNSESKTVTLAAIYKQAYDEVFKRQPHWKQEVIKECSNKEDRVLVEFAKETSIRAEEIILKLNPVDKS